MKATLKRRVNEAHAPVHDEWLLAWTEWGSAVMRRWQAVDRQAQSRHGRFIQPLYLEWAAAVQAGELPTFLARGTSLAKWWPSAPALWEWLWAAQRGWLEHDLRKWPSRLPTPPEVPKGALERVVASMETAEECALALAICSAR